MPDEMVVFENETFGQIRTVRMDDGETWFVAVDVCRALEIKPTATRRLDDDEKGMRLMQTPGGEQEMTIINEPGLYTLVLGSRKPEAKAFKRWITHEVLPEIRKTGGYSMKVKELNAEIERMDRHIDLLYERLDERGERIMRLTQMIPIMDSDDLLTLYEVADRLNMFPSELNRELVSMRLLYWNAKGQLAPNPSTNAGYFTVKKRRVPEADFYGWTTLVTPSGYELIRLIVLGADCNKNVISPYVAKK